MKYKTLRNGLIVSVLAMTFCLSAVIVVTSCQKQSFEDEPVAPQSERSQVAEELPYLDFSEDYSENSDLSNEDLKVFLTALQRANVKKIDGLWQMTVSDEATIKVAPRVMSYLEQVIENSNAQIISRLSVMSTTPRMRKPGGGEGEDDPEQSANDCVAKCFGWIHKNMGFGPSYDTANSWINDRFGVGVPIDSMEVTLHHFYGADHVSSFPINDQNGAYRDSLSVVILNYQIDTTGHAVIYEGTYNGIHVAKDPQFDEVRRLVDKDDVISSFKVTK